MGRCVYICDMNVKKFDNGGRTQRQRQLDRLARRFERRQPDVVYGDIEQEGVQGRYDSGEHKIFLEEGVGEDVEYHERLQAAQRTAFQRLIDKGNEEANLKIQDPVLRKGFRSLMDLYSGPLPEYSRDTDEYGRIGLKDDSGNLTEAGTAAYMTLNPDEFEAIFKSGLKSLYDSGVNVKQIAAGSSFEDMVGFINQNKNASNNTRGLAKYANYLSKEGSDEQKKVFMDLLETEYGY